MFLVLFGLSFSLFFGFLWCVFNKDKLYWKGRGEGWQACENMVIDRAKENPKYNKTQIWEDLIE